MCTNVIKGRRWTGPPNRRHPPRTQVSNAPCRIQTNARSDSDDRSFTVRVRKIGYKGTIADRVRVTLDGYFEQKKNFVAPLRVESPFAYLKHQSLTLDVGGRLGEIFTTTSDATVHGLLSTLQSSGLPSSETAQILADIVGSGLDKTPTAIVQPDQDGTPLLSGGGSSDQVGAFLSYRNFGTVQYWGIDASSEADVTNTATLFGNVSIVSDDYFTNEELDESDTSVNLALNAPSLKVKGGFQYGLPAGFSIGATGE